MGPAKADPTVERPAVPQETLESVVLCVQIGIMWPDDGRTHYYGPGEVKLPKERVAALRNLAFRVVAK